MDRRLILQEMLVEFLGSNNVYYQPPETLKMEYPCIKYSKTNIYNRYANNRKYTMMDCYILTIIDKKVDNPVIKKILELPMSSFDRHYVYDNLNHDVIRLYF